MAGGLKVRAVRGLLRVDVGRTLAVLELTCAVFCAGTVAALFSRGDANVAFEDGEFKVRITPQNENREWRKVVARRRGGKRKRK